MTSEEAAERLKMILEEATRYEDAVCYVTSDDADALEMAIKALEQEPKTWSFDDAREDFMSDVYNTLDFLPTNNEANRIIDSFDRVTSSIECDVLDKIRAEIEQITDTMGVSYNQYVSKIDVLRIIDKYKAESEEV